MELVQTRHADRKCNPERCFKTADMQNLQCLCMFHSHSPERQNFRRLVHGLYTSFLCLITGFRIKGLEVVELVGIEPTTSSLRTMRSPTRPQCLCPSNEHLRSNTVQLKFKPNQGLSGRVASQLFRYCTHGARVPRVLVRVGPPINFVTPS